MRLPESRTARAPANQAADSIRQWLLPGLIGGGVFLAVAIVTGAFTTTAWAMPEGIAHTMDIAAPARYGFASGLFLAGVVAHLAVSVGLGVIFTAIARRLRFRGGVLVIAALIFAGVEPGIVIWGVLHPMLPSGAFHYFLTAIPLWASILGHLSYGLALGLALVATTPGRSST